MSAADLNTIDTVIHKAAACGALLSIRTEQTYIEENGITFLLRWAPALAGKPAAHKPTASPGSARRNPFLPPEAELTVGTAGPEHLLVLNKYPVIERHLLIITRAFVDQTMPLTQTDFAALADVMARLGGLGFYNGGTLAGASQSHKHLQWIPESPQSNCMRGMTAGLPAGSHALTTTRHPLLPWRHAFVRLTTAGKPPSAETLQTAFDRACIACDLHPDQGHMPPYNLLTNDQWLLVVPRRREHCEGVSINALGFAGSMFVRHAEEVATVRRIGPLKMLAAVACD